MKAFLKVLIPFMYHDRKVLLLNRCSNFLYKLGWIRLALILEGVLLRIYGCHISCQCLLPITTRLPHPVGIVIGAGCVIEEHVTIYQGVTLGRNKGGKAAYPKICSDVVIYANAVIVGDITVNKGCLIGALSLLNKNTIENSQYFGIPARKM